MASESRIFLILLGIPTVAASFLMTGCSESASPPSAINLSELGIVIRTHKDSLILNEPIFICLEIRNKGEKCVYIPEPDNDYVATVRLMVRPIRVNQGWRMAYVQDLATRAGDTVKGKDVWKLDAGQVQGVEYGAMRGSPNPDEGSDLLFPEPGRYEIRNELSIWGCAKPLISDVLEVEVREATGADKEAFEYLKAQPPGGRLERGFIPGPESHVSQEQLVRFVDRHPKAVYAQYARQTLGMTCFIRDAESRMRYLRDVVYDEGAIPYLRASCASRLVSEIKLSGNSGGRDVVDHIRKQIGDLYDKGRRYPQGVFAVGVPLNR